LNSSRFNFSKARNDGYDIRFTDSDGTTLLKYERERHNADNQLAEYHVKIPSLTAGQDKVIYMHYGNSSASDGADPTNVWDSNFVAVWHMKDYTSSQFNDSTSNANNATKKAANEPIEVDAKIGRGQSFDGANDYASASNSSSLNSVSSALTMEAWVYFNNLPANSTNFIFVKGRDTNATMGYQWAFTRWGGTNNEYALGVAIQNNTPSWIFSGNNTISTGAWYYCVFTYNGSYEKIYLNAILKNSVTDGGNINTTSYPLDFGARRNTGGSWSSFSNAIFDEIRISNIVRSDAWIKASYHSGNDTLVSYGIEEFLGSRRRLLFSTY
jgi:hypothetical protein